MEKKTLDKRGQNGTKNLNEYRKKGIVQRKKTLQKTLNEFAQNNIPLVIADLSAQSGISIATLGRSPYKEMIKKHLDAEKIRLSPRGKQEISILIKENIKLKEEIEFLKEKNKRLLKESFYIKELLLR